MRERKTLIRKFEDDLQDRVDLALLDGIEPQEIRRVLEDEISADLQARLYELKDATAG